MSKTVDQIANMAKQLIAENESVSNLEITLKEAKERSRVLREETIPSAMQEEGLTSFKLSSGQEITIRQEVYASIPAQHVTEAFAWLNDHGFGGLIKTTVTTEYGKGDSEAAVQLANDLTSKGLQTSFNEKVHPSTLKSFLKEQINAGTNIPLAIFGANPVFKAVIK